MGPAGARLTKHVLQQTFQGIRYKFCNVSVDSRPLKWLAIEWSAGILIIVET
jgi:hypothetical protein